MKYDFKEYEKMIEELNMNKNRYVYLTGTVAVAITMLLIGFFQYKMDVVTCVFYSGLITIMYYYLLKYIIIRNAKNINMSNKIVSVEIEIKEDVLIERVIKENNNENISECNYLDVSKIKEDKNNFYLYLTKNAAIIISKEKLEDIENFKKLLEAKCINAKKEKK